MSCSLAGNALWRRSFPASATTSRAAARFLFGWRASCVPSGRGTIPSPRAISDEALKGFAAKLGYGGVVALDQDWSQLKAVYLSTGKREATSVSFLVDKKGIIRFVHPGPDYFPSDEREKAQQDEDYRLMEKAIQELLR